MPPQHLQGEETCPVFTAKCVDADDLFPRTTKCARQISSIQDSLRTFNDNIQQISNMHSRSLNNTDEAATQRIAQQLEQLVEDTGALGSQLKRRIKTLESQGGAGRDGQIRKQQVGFFLPFGRVGMLKAWW